MMRPCLDCGELTEDRRCDDHQDDHQTRQDTWRGNPRDRGYTTTWDRLSLRARRAQPWCSDCGTTDNLTTDHRPSAWAREAAGLPLRLEDVDVVCSDDNQRRGSSRPGSDRHRHWTTWGVDPADDPTGPGGKAGSLTLTPGGYL